jgi:hypothetical protein
MHNRQWSSLSFLDVIASVRFNWRFTMIITSKSEGHISKQPSVRRAEEISAAELLGLSLACIYRWINGFLLRGRLRSLERQADYFTWQQENGAAGLADTHKRIAMVRSDLHRLRF